MDDLKNFSNNEATGSADVSQVGFAELKETAKDRANIGGILIGAQLFNNYCPKMRRETLQIKF